MGEIILLIGLLVLLFLITKGLRNGWIQAQWRLWKWNHFGKAMQCRYCQTITKPLNVLPGDKINGEVTNLRGLVCTNCGSLVR